MLEYGNMTSYYGQIGDLAREYVRTADHMCSMRDKGTEVLDKPNCHRLLELCLRTIPMFGHARNFSELMLDMLHRVFKNWIRTNTQANARLSAVELAFTKDW